VQCKSMRAKDYLQSLIDGDELGCLRVTAVELKSLQKLMEQEEVKVVGWTETNRQLGLEAVAQRVKGFRADVIPHISAAQRSGLSKLVDIAHYLNTQGVKTSRGGKWQAIQVSRVLDAI